MEHMGATSANFLIFALSDFWTCMTYWHLTRQNRDLLLLCAMLRRLFENMSPAITAHLHCLGCSSASDSYALEVHNNLLGRVLCWFGDNRMRYSQNSFGRVILGSIIIGLLRGILGV